MTTDDLFAAGAPPYVAYTDGSCSPNPGPGGWACILNGETLSGAEPASTNNRMELMAAITALEAVPAGRPIEIRADSSYVINGATRWLRGWARNGWRTREGAVKNVDLWQRLARAQSAHKVKWTWVRGHTGVAGNEQADRAANAARECLTSTTAKAVARG
ncbi:MAG TPA: ribonuclease HI [Nevskiaceae bacterium]|nr:ribonuclease HI [Nevskiaceae bacterium]